MAGGGPQAGRSTGCGRVSGWWGGGPWLLACLGELGLCAWPPCTSASLRLRPGSRAMRLWRRSPPAGCPRSWAETALRAPRHTMWHQRWRGLWCSKSTLPFRTDSGRVEGPGLVAITDTKTCAQALLTSGRSEGIDCILKP